MKCHNLEPLKLFAAYGASQGAGHLLTTVFATTVYDQRSSAVLAGAVLGLNYLPSALLTSVIGPWVDGHGSRRTLAGIEVGSLALTLLCVLVAAVSPSLPALFALLSLRAVLMATARSGYARWLKLISPPATQARRMKLFTLTFMSASTLAGLLAWAVLLGPPSGLFIRLGLAAALLHLAAVAGVGLLRKLPGAAPGARRAAVRSDSLLSALRSIRESRPLRESCLAVIFSQATFQAGYLGLIVLLPVIGGLGPGGAGLCQFAGSVGLLGGFVIAFTRSRLIWAGGSARRLPCLAAAAVGAAALLAAVLAPAPWSLGALAVMLLAYEVVFLPHQAAYFQASPPERTGQYQNLLSSVGGLLMALTCVLFAALCEAVGPAAGALAFLALLGAAGASAWLVSRPRPADQPAPDLAVTIGAMRSGALPVSR